MIVRSVNEVVIHLESFRNIDLVFQGIYTIRVSAFEKLPNNKRLYAHPYQFTESYPQPIETVFISTPRTDAATSCFYSKSFMVRFFEEEIDINDICSFRIEFQISEQESRKLSLEIALMFYDYSTNKNQGLLKEHLSPGELQEKVRLESKVIETRTLVLSGLNQPTHNFWPVLFNDHYFCEVGMIVHSTCLDYRFRVSDLQLSQYVKLSPQEKARILSQNKKIDKKGFSISASLSQSLKMSQENPSKQILIAQEILINQLKGSYEKLYSHFQTMAAKCIIDKDKSRKLKDVMLPNSLILPSQDSGLLKLPTHQRLTVKYKSIYPDSIITNILSQSNLISSQLALLWIQTLQLYKMSPKPCRYLLQNEWMITQKDIWSNLVEKRVRVGNDFEALMEVNEFNKNKSFQDMRGRKERQNLFDLKFYPEQNEAPMMIEHLYLRQKGEKELETSIQYKGIHLFVLAHGFQGTNQDMKLIKNYLLHLHPQAMLLSSSTNQDQTDTDIEVLGLRLANQVKTYINDHCPQGSLGRLSFIGYSMGGLNIRAALPHLSEFKSIMHSFITFSTPHLGLPYPSSTIVNAGIWFYNKMLKSTCLKQMSCNDAENLQDTMIYKLAHMEGLGWFKHILLLGSRQDDYAPYQSARIEMCRGALADTKNGAAYRKMAEAITSSIKGGRLHRMDVSFYIKQTTFSSIIGRAAHIMFLDSHTLIKTLMFSYRSLFD